MGNTRADGAIVACPLFQAGDGGANPTSALDLLVQEISVQTAMELNALWHSRLPKTDFNNLIRTKILVCYGARFDDKWYAVAIWTNPVARLLPQDTWLELRRLAVCGEAPRNTASRILAIMRMLLVRKLPHIDKFISYQDEEVHTGAIYRADGWVADSMGKQNHWERPNRSRNKTQSAAPKTRWSHCT